MSEHLQASGAGKTPKLQLAQQVQTPNTLFTPFRTPGGPASGAPQTPLTDKPLPGSATPGGPLRDKFNINMSDHGSDFSLSAEDNMERQFNLKKGLSKLPAPKNDYEIVLPDDEQARNKDDEEMREEGSELVDQADIDQARANEIKLKRELEFKLKSTAIQRNLPRPKTQINTNIIRPVTDAQAELNEWQIAEEMIKKEMLFMLHMDAINEPMTKSGQPHPHVVDKCAGYLRENYSTSHLNQKFTLEELAEVRILSFI
jgi:pre-mRNA-splicing factor CDC5/CEF1